MKKSFFVVMAVMFLCFSASKLFAGGGAGPVSDSLRTAQIFGKAPIDSHEGYINFRRNINGDYVYIVYKMLADGKVPYYKVGENVIVKEGDEPLQGLPINAVGETRDFNDNISAKSKSDYVGYGYFYAPLLNPGDPIVIILKPNWVILEVPFPDGNNNIFLETSTGGIYNYNDYIKGFYVSFDPSLGSISYTIIDSASGIVYMRDAIDPLADEEPEKNNVNSEVTILLPNGVKEVPDTQFAYFQRQQLDGYVGGAPAGVYLWDLKKKHGNIYLNGIFGAIEVRRWAEQGKMPVVASGADTYIDVPDGYEKVVVIITGDITYGDGFSINLNRSW